MMRQVRLLSVVLAVVCAGFCSQAVGEVIYVDDDAGASGDGQSWSTAYKYLQEGLLDPNLSYGDEIWVAEGIYKPDQDESGNVDPNDRLATFQLVNGVGLYGGYAGIGAADPNVRDPNNFETILNGDLAGNDGDDFVNYEENSYHVATSSDVDPNTILNGFVITEGNADGEYPVYYFGGGMYNGQNSRANVINCIFRDNTANSLSGMYNFDSTPEIKNCVFTGNANNALFNHQANPRIYNCIFTENTSSAVGILYNYQSNPVITNCIFSNNTGIGMYNFQQSEPTITNCEFSSNSNRGMYNNNSSPTVFNCVFIGNTGGGVVNHSGGPIIDTCMFTGNSSVYGGGVYGDGIITNCTFINNTASMHGGGIYNGGTIINCTFRNNTAEYGGGMYTQETPTVSNCQFLNNRAEYGGGICVDEYGNPTVDNCKIIGNWAGEGGGVYNKYFCSSVFNNCIFADNRTANSGGGIHVNELSQMRATNCTFIANRAQFVGGGIYISQLASSTSRVTNCILWDDKALSGAEEIFGWQIEVTYSNVMYGQSGVGNIDVDPLFADTSAADPNEWDYHLKSVAGRWDPNSGSWVYDGVTSACIDAGNPGRGLGEEVADENNVRVNMGAYGGTAEASKTPEGWGVLGDLSNNWKVGLEDYSMQATDWMVSAGERPGDLNRDGGVNLPDVSLLAGDWLKVRQLVAQMEVEIDENCASSVGFGSEEEMWEASQAGEEVRFSVRAEGSYIIFEDMMEANCCPGELWLEMEVAGDLITINEHQQEEGCWCICEFETSARLGPFSPGDYMVEVYGVWGGFVGVAPVTIGGE